MGSGISVHENGDSASKLRFKARKILVSSPTKGKPLNGEDPFTQSDSKEETFFDSQAWLDSDCDDDYLSVNGDFTPSRGSTSSQRNSSVRNPHKSESTDKDTPLHSPTDKKKKLSELLRESSGGEDGELESKADNLIPPSNSTNGISYLFPYFSRSSSVHSSDRTPSKCLKSDKEKPTGVMQCCLPGLVKSFSFSERKKKLSPDVSGGG